MQTLHVAGFTLKQQEALEKKNFSFIKDGPETFLVLTITRNFSNHLREIDSVINNPEYQQIPQESVQRS